MKKPTHNAIWKYDTGRIVLYTEDPVNWKKIRRSYSEIVKEMAKYYAENFKKPFAKQYLAPIEKRKTFEKMLKVKMQIF